MKQSFPDMDAVLHPYCRIRVPGKRHPTGKVYEVPEPSARLGLELVSLLTTEDAELAPFEEADLLERICGPVWQQMHDDHVTHRMKFFAGRTVLIYYGISPNRALDYLSGGMDPTIPPRRQTRRLWWSLTSRRPASTAQETPAAARG